MLSIVKKHLFLLLIIITAVTWRFVNYEERWVLNQDQARDASIALYSIRNHQIPLVGSPSSAGPFSFGPLYDYLVIFSTFILPIEIGPWIIFTTFSVVTVLIFYYIGVNFSDKKLGYCLALIAAFSSNQISNSPDMLNTVIVSFAATLAFFSLIKLIEQKNIVYSLLLSFFVGFAINCHFQSLGLLSLLLMAFLVNDFSWAKKIQTGVGLFLGFIISFIPLIYFDITNKFVWIKSVFTYYTSGIDKFYVPVRWLTDIRDFWPQLFGQVITGLPLAGYFLILVCVIALAYIFIKRTKIQLSLWIIMSSLLIQVFLIRYYKGVRSPEYLIAFHPYFIFLIGWSVWIINKNKKYFGIILLLCILSLSFRSNLRIVKQKSQAQIILSLKKELDKKYGHGSFEIYSHSNSNMASLPIFYLLYFDNRVNTSSIKLGICDNIPIKNNQGIYQNNCPAEQIIISQKNNYIIYDLSRLTEEEIIKLNYEKFTPEKIFNWLMINYPEQNV